MFRKLMEIVAALVFFVVFFAAMGAAYKYGERDVYRVDRSRNDDQVFRVVTPDGQVIPNPQEWWEENKNSVSYTTTWVAPQWLRDEIAAESR